MSTSPRDRARAFCDHFSLRVPVIMGPMAGSSPPKLAAAVASAGGLGGCGAKGMSAEQIADWVAAFRISSNGDFQINTWMPDSPVTFSPEAVDHMRALLARRGFELGPVQTSGLPDFVEQCEAIISARPSVASSIMGLYPPDVVAAFKRQGTAWFANVTTLSEAKKAEAAGADAIVLSGLEAGGHRGSFDQTVAERHSGTLFALLPIVSDELSVPVIAAGAIADGRGLAAALTLGASAVQIGTALLRAPEANTAPVWADAIAKALPEDTVQTRAFSGRLARTVRNAWIEEVGSDALHYPMQAQAVSHLRASANARGDAEAMAMWAGQAAKSARALPAEQIVTDMWTQANALLA